MLLISISDVWLVVLVGMATLFGFALVLLITIVVNQRRFVRLNKEAELRSLDIPKKILDAQERERRRVAQDLHDGVNQVLRSIRLRLEESFPYLRAPENVMNDMRRIGDDLEEAADEINRISHNLLPSQLDHLGLLPAIRSLGNEFSSRTGIAMRYRFIGVPERFDREIELGLFRIVQECLNNIEKHARAESVDIELDKDEHSIIAVVQDNGNGFTNMSLATAKGTPLGVGIHTMKERASLLHGSVSIESMPFEGTRVITMIPLSKNPRHHSTEERTACAA
jgi:two-component system NarL family sensor kinase